MFAYRRGLCTVASTPKVTPKKKYLPTHLYYKRLRQAELKLVSPHHLVKAVMKRNADTHKVYPFTRDAIYKACEVHPLVVSGQAKPLRNRSHLKAILNNLKKRFIVTSRPQKGQIYKVRKNQTALPSHWYFGMSKLFKLFEENRKRQLSRQDKSTRASKFGSFRLNPSPV